MVEPAYAGFGERLAAALIDRCLIYVLLITMLMVVYAQTRSIEDIFTLGTRLVSVLVPFILTLWFWRRFLATPGKMLLRLQVVDANTGQPLSLKQSTIRYLGYTLSILALGMGFFWIVFDAKKQGWHDKLAGSVVVRNP